MISKYKIDFDESSPSDHDRIGSYIIGLGGNVVTSTTVGSDEAVDVYLTGLSVSEDSAAGDAYTGMPIFAVRQDTLSSLVDADGDFASLKVDSLGRLWTNTDITPDVADDDASSGNPLYVGGLAHDASSALTALSADGDRSALLMDLYRRVFTNDACNIGWSVTAETVTNTSGQLVSGGSLAGRKKVIIQNQSNGSVWIKNTTAVADNTSIEIPKYSSMEFEWGEALPIHAIGASASHAIAVMEAA